MKSTKQTTLSFQLILFVTSLLLLVNQTTAFPENLPIHISSQLADFRNVSIFTGSEGKELRDLHKMERMQVAGREYLVISSREALFFMDSKKLRERSTITADKTLKLPSNSKKRFECEQGYREGVDTSMYCFNQILVVLPLNSKGEELFVCGTGVYRPKCAIYQAKHDSSGQLNLKIKGPLIEGTYVKIYISSDSENTLTSIVSNDRIYSTSFVEGKFLLSSNKIDNLVDNGNISKYFWTNEQALYSSKGNTMFISSHELQDRILFFLNEQETSPTGQHRFVAEVAQVCKNDPGLSDGDMYHNWWSTFLKARLVCAYNEVYMTEIQDIVFTSDDIFYAVFTMEEIASAICKFSVNDVIASMNGEFVAGAHEKPLEAAKFNSKMIQSDEHPGNCAVSSKTSRQTKEDIIQHPLMQKQVEGELLSTYLGASFTSLAIRHNIGPQNDVTMMYIGTSAGQLLRVLLPDSRWPQGAIIEESSVFDEERCFSESRDDKKVVRISVEGDQLLVAFTNCIISRPLVTCQRFKCNSSCLASADPECGWSDLQDSCQKFVTISQQLSQDIESAIKTQGKHQECKEVVSDVVPVTTDTAVKLSTAVVPAVESEKSLDTSSKPQSEESGQASKEGYPLMVLILVVLLSSTATLVLVLLVWCWYKGRSRGPNFEQKQLALQQSEMMKNDGKKESWTRRILCKCDIFGFGWKSTKDSSTTISSPVTSYKNDHEKLVSKPPEKPIDYSESPTLPMSKQQQFIQRKEEARLLRRISSSRQDSESSVNSRRSNYNFEMKLANASLGVSPSIVGDPFNTSGAASRTSSMLRSDPRPIPSNYKSPSSATSSRENSSPVFHETGAAECGVLPTASAKMRRRNEQRASKVTNEIMRDSQDAVQQFENAVHHLLQNGIGSPAPYSHLRSRLDSDDSGKGTSPRNSLQQEYDQLVDNRQTRPSSLHLGRPQIRRSRLTSEPTYDVTIAPPRPNELMTSGSPARVYQPSFASTPSSMRSGLRLHPPTPPSPNNGAFVPYKQLANYPAYATLPIQQPQGVPHPQRRTRHVSGSYPYQAVLKEHSRVSSPLMTSAVVTSSSSKSSRVPNRYPSLVIRGSHANLKPFPRNSQCNPIAVTTSNQCPTYYTSSGLEGGPPILMRQLSSASTSSGYHSSQALSAFENV